MPYDTITAERTLANRALLVTLSISQWEARKLDRSETAEVAKRHGTVNGVARVNKSLLPTADSLEKVHKKTAEIRNEYYRLSLPWGQNGVQIVKASAYIDFTRKMGDMMDDWRALVAAFVAEYPTLLQEAQSLLNTLWNAEDYPPVEVVASKFSIGMRFLPVPDSADWRVEIGDAELDRLRSEIVAHVQESEQIAMKAAWQRVHDLVAKTYERLSNPDTLFRDSLVDNARELCAVLPSLNITDDPKLEDMRRALEVSICANTPEILRTQPQVRAEVATAMKDIMAKMGGLM